MTDNLRDRLIKAIGAEVYGDIGNSDLSLATRAADAVIAALDLQPIQRPTMFPERRWVTPWELIDGSASRADESELAEWTANE